MKKIMSKKWAGAFTVALLVSTIGAVLVSAQTTETDDSVVHQEEWVYKNFEKMAHGCGNFHGFRSQLTEEQREEISSKVSELKGNGASREDIKETVKTMLEEYDIEIPDTSLTEEEKDERLDKEIEHTEQKLEILNKIKELREQGATEEEIRAESEQMMEEFGIELPGEYQHGCRGSRGHRGFQDSQYGFGVFSCRGFA